MNERQRTQYLADLGIDVFVPRFILPSARASVQAELPVVQGAQNTPLGSSTFSSSESNAGNTAVELNQQSQSKSPSVVSGIVSNIMVAFDDGLPKPTLEKAKFKEPGLDVPKSQSKERVAFTLSLWRVNSSLMVIDTHQPKQALPTNALLASILFAKSITQRLPSPEVLTWPMFPGSDVSGGWGEARDMVGAFMQARLSTQPVKYIWLMGDAALQSLLEEQDYSKKVGAAIDLQSFSALGLVLPSLSDMLLEPELKRIAWSAIRSYSFT